MEWMSVNLGMISNNVYAFLGYAALWCVVYYVLPVRMRVGVLLAGSILFYALCDPRFLVLLVIETVLGWEIGNRVRGENGRRWLVVGVVMCMGTLLAFKYCGILWNVATGDVLTILLPLGISYYSFRIVSYLVDIYRGDRDPEPSLSIYCVYVMFFPQLVSGPIARSERMTEQMHEGIRWQSANLEAGMHYILSGLFKKVVLADRMSAYVNIIYAAPEAYPAVAAWLAAFLYAVQLYTDFAGYSEIAIGITRCYGLDCMSNFERPYLARDMKDFWRRWHISLSSWLRDYVYIPCGGSRMDKRWKVDRNVLVTFVVCGIWHGAGLHYMLWGLYHGIWNIMASAGRSVRLRIPRILETCITFLIAMFGWILFKAEGFVAAGGYIRRMFCGLQVDFASLQAAILPFTQDNSCAAYAATLFILMGILFLSEIYDEQHQLSPEGYSNLRVGGIFALVILFGMTGGSSFLYANF